MDSKKIIKNTSFVTNKSNSKYTHKQEFLNQYDRKIEQDYFTLKQNESDIKSNKPQESLSTETYKTWYKMAFSRGLMEKFSQLNSSDIKSKGGNNNPGNSPKSKTSKFQVLEDSDEKFNLNNQNSSLKKNQSIFLNTKQSAIEENKTDFLKDSGKFIKNYVSVAEQGLRRFFKFEKEKFLKRLEIGPPENFRWISWIVSSQTSEYRTDDQYYSLLEIPLENHIEVQIKKDLHRTLTDDNLFVKESTQKSLYNVLKAFSNIDKEVLYCQGMNSVAAFALVKSNFNEADSFYLLLSLFSNTFGDGLGIRGFYLPEFPLLQLFMYQFDYIFFKKMPNLKQHFENLDLPNEAWVSKWFQTLFTISMPLCLVTRVWDCIFTFGIEFIFNFTLAILKHFEEDLLKFNDMTDLSDYLKGLNPYLNKMDTKHSINIEKLIEESKKIVIPKQVFENLRKEYENIHKIDFNKLKLTYPVKQDIPELDRIISFGEDLSVIDFASQTVINEVDFKGKLNTLINHDFNESQNSDNSLDISVGSEFDYEQRGLNVSEKINSHVLKLGELKDSKIQTNNYSKTVKVQSNENKKILGNLNKIDLKGVIGRNSTETNDNTTNVRSVD